MNKHHSMQDTQIEERRVEEFASHSSSNKNDMSIRIIHIKELLTGRFTVIFAVLLLVVVGLVAYQQTSTKKVKTIVVQKQVLLRRSMSLGFTQRALTGKGIDIATGKIVAAARIFNDTIDKKVYLELDLAQAPQGTKIDTISYKAHRYVSHNEVSLQQSNIKNILFSWNLSTALSKLVEGQWTVATYENGILSKRVSYVVKSGVISYIYPQHSISSRDPEYLLGRALAQAKRE